MEPPWGSEPGFRRPVLIVQADSFNRSRIRTVAAVAVSTNLGLLEGPGNVLLPASETGLPRDSAANVTQITTLDRGQLIENVGRIPPRIMARVDAGLRLVLDL